MPPSNFGLHKLLQNGREAKKPVVGEPCLLFRFIGHMALMVTYVVWIVGSWLMLPGASLARMVAQMGFDVSLVLSNLPVLSGGP